MALGKRFYEILREEKAKIGQERLDQTTNLKVFERVYREIMGSRILMSTLGIDPGNNTLIGAAIVNPIGEERIRDCIASALKSVLEVQANCLDEIL